MSSKAFNNKQPSNAVILTIDTAAQGCSVALCTENDEVVFERTDSCREVSNAALIGGFVQSAMNFAKEHHKDIVAIAVTAGPGSYTGLRIGASVAKGLAFSLTLPLLAIPTLEAIAHSYKKGKQERISSQDLIVSMFDANKEEAYIQLYDADLKALSDVECIQVQPMLEERVTAAKPMGKVHIVGTGVEKCSNGVSLPISATLLRTAAWVRFNDNNFSDVAYWQPLYVKPYKAVIGKNKVLNR